MEDNSEFEDLKKKNKRPYLRSQQRATTSLHNNVFVMKYQSRVRKFITFDQLYLISIPESYAII